MKIIIDKNFIQNKIILCQLGFERAMDKFDIDAANIQCAQKDYWISELSKFN